MPKARKDYHCDLCHFLIRKDTLYHYQRVTPWEHPENESFGNYRAHNYCNALWSRIGQESDWEMYDYADFRMCLTDGKRLTDEAIEAIANQPVPNVAPMPAAASPNAAELADKVL